MTLTPIALIDLGANNLPKEGYLHAFVSKKTHIKSSRVVKLISHPMWTIEVSLKHPKFERIGIHLFQEVLYVAFRELPAAHKLVIIAYV